MSMTISAPDARKNAEDFQGKISEFLVTLYGRWQDEHEYEDFEEYKKAMKSRLPEGWEFVGMHKRPFSVTVRGREKGWAELTVICTSTYIKWAGSFSGLVSK